MAAETIREYLVALGFKIDETAFRKFNSAVFKTTEPVLKLGAAAAAAATAIEVMVERVARQMEDLYYAAQRTYATADSLQAVGFAAKQVGLEASRGTDLLEGLGRALRMNPGAEGLISSFGVKTREANGQLRDMSGVLDDLLSKLAGMPRFQALRMGQVFGFDPDTLNQVLNNLPQFLKAQDDARRSLRNFGINAQDAAAKGMDFSRAVNAVDRDIGNLATRIGIDWIPQAKAMAEWVDKLVVDFGKWNDQMGGTPGKIASILSALGGVLGILKILSKIPGFGFLAPVVSGSVVGAGTLAGAVGAAQYGASSELLKKSGGAVFAVDPFTGMPYYTNPADNPLGLRSNNPLNLMPGGKEAVFGSALEGLTAGAKNLLRYAQHGWDTIQAILAHWAPAAAGNNVAAYVADVAKRTGFSAGQHLNLSDPGTLERLMGAMIFHEQGRNPFSVDMLSSAAKAAVVTMSQKTDIHVYGGNASDTGRRVAGEQDRVNGDMVRNLGSVMR